MGLSNHNEPNPASTNDVFRLHNGPGQVDTSVTIPSSTDILESLKSQNPIDLSNLVPFRRLIVINDFLTSQGLRKLEGLGDANQGEIEFIGINRFQTDPYVARIDFQYSIVRQGVRKTANHLNFIGANTALTGNVVGVPVITCAESNQEYFLMVKTFRPVIGRTFVEFPRGFAESLNDVINASPIANAIKELEEESGVLQHAVIHQTSLLGEFYENTGTSNACTSIVQLELKVPNNLLLKLKDYIHTEHSGQRNHIMLIPTRIAPELMQDGHSINAYMKWLLKNTALSESP